GFDLEYNGSDGKPPVLFSHIKQGDEIKVKGLQFAITSPVQTQYDELKVSYISYYAIMDIADGLTIKEAERELPILLATYVSANGLFTRDFLKNLIRSFQDYEVDFKRKSSELTLEFINAQLERFNDALQLSSTKLEDFKRTNDLIDVGTTATELMKVLTELQNKKYELEIQDNNIELLIRQLNGNKDV